METRPYVVHALSPLHAGTGQSAGVIDLPIARMKATGIPFVPGSSIKGVLRDATRPEPELPPPRGLKRAEINDHRAMFGPLRQPPGTGGDTAEAIDHAGALMVSDARLMALPVRSFRGTFALVTSPLLLDLLRRDLVQAGVRGVPQVPQVERDHAWVASDCVCNPDDDKRIYLEDLDLVVQGNDEVKAWCAVITGALAGDDQALMSKRLVIVSDETMTFLWETATQVDTRVRIDHETHVVDGTGLWTEESLPPETLLIGLMSATRSMRAGTELAPSDMLDRVLPASGAVVQFGGKATIGKGRCRMVPWQRRAAGEGGQR